MNRQHAKRIADLLSLVTNQTDSKYKLSDKILSKKLSGFHQWVDGKPCEGAFLFKDEAERGFWILLIDWKKDENFYVVLYPESKINPVAEINELIDEEPAEAVLKWRYSPKKRDGRNDERKTYFIKMFHSDEVQISVPAHIKDVDDFIDELFTLAISRSKADELDPERPSVRNRFPEGKIKEKLHSSRERNPELIRQAKNNAMRQDDCLKCVCCGFDFFTTYGEIGSGFIEAHHTKPVSTLHEDGEETLLDDIALVCSNCHRMLHRRRPWLGMEDLSELLVANKAN